MNLLFQALAIFSLVIPGIIFRAAYFQASWKYPKGRLGSISDEVPRALIVAAAVDRRGNIVLDWEWVETSPERPDLPRDRFALLGRQTWPRT